METRDGSRAERRAEAMRRVTEISVVIAILIALAVAVWGTGCATTEVEAQPLTVTPHPTMGFKIVIVPVGTDIGGFVTTEMGFYLTADVVLQLLEQRDGPLTWSKL